MKLYFVIPALILFMYGIFMHVNAFSIIVGIILIVINTLTLYDQFNK